MSRQSQAGREPATPDTELRIDKWLWHCRFFKSRSQATDAVAGGLVHVNDERAKPSRVVRIGDTLVITRDEVRFMVSVKGIPTRRGPASEAQQQYEESEASRLAREQIRERRRMAPPAPDSRPDKHARKLLRELRRR